MACTYHVFGYVQASGQWLVCHFSKNCSKKALWSILSACFPMSNNKWQALPLLMIPIWSRQAIPMMNSRLQTKWKIPSTCGMVSSRPQEVIWFQRHVSGYLIDFHWENRDMWWYKMWGMDECQLCSLQPDGTQVMIPWLHTAEACHTLGICLAPDGNNNKDYKHFCKVTTQWSCQMTMAQLSQLAVDFSLWHVLK